MLLLTGPPGAGKTAFCLSELRTCLRDKKTGCRLLVPTSTMAEHLRNELAREGFVFSPKLVTTFGRLVDEYALDSPPVGRGILEILVGQVLDAMPAGRYEGVREFAGFRAAVASAVNEFAGAGGGMDHLRDVDPEFAHVFTEVMKELQARGLSLRAQRLRVAADRIRRDGGPAQVWVTGFTGFTPPEREVLAALAERSDVTVTLPEGARLPEAKIFQSLPARNSEATRTLVVAATPDAEANEVARRVLSEKASGRAWRDLAVVLRGPGSLPLVRSAFERFGVPARYYFLTELDRDVTVRYLLSVAEAALNGWPHELAVEALRMHGSPLEGSGDKWEFEVRERLPGAGLETLRQLAPEKTEWYFAELEKLTPWRDEKHSGQGWAERFAALQALFRPGAIRDGSRADLWREQAAALSSWEAGCREAALALSGTVFCAEYLSALRTVLRSATVRTIERRRDVVSVIDAVEARQWKLPVVFVVGLLEGQFPRHHVESPILPDAVRKKLRASGVELRTAGDRQTEEAALFDLVVSRATSATYLSYAALNAKGELNLPSFLLERARPFLEEKAAAVRPRARRARGAEPFPIIQGDETRRTLWERHAKLSPSGVEMYAQCPFQFFAERTLRLKSPPKRPWDRLTMLEQGTIAHRTFESYFRDGAAVERAFEQAFEEVCAENGVPSGYRTEAVRLELLDNVRQLVGDDRAHLKGQESLFEKDFEFALDESTTLRGRIDRVEVTEGGRAVVFDYKYRRADRLRDTVKENEDGTRVQGGLYLLGAESMGYRPAGMVYWGFKGEVSVAGWVLPGLYPKLKSECSETHLDEVMQTAKSTALQVAAQLREGRIEAAPADMDKCEYCGFAAMCRVEVRETPRVAEVAGGTE